MGTFFVIFSIAPRVLIGRIGHGELAFSLAFASVAAVMIATTRFAKHFAVRRGIAGRTARGMALLLIGATLATASQLALQPSLASFILPMWIMAVGIVFTVAVTAHGALSAPDERAGTAVALHFCIPSLRRSRPLISEGGAEA